MPEDQPPSLTARFNWGSATLTVYFNQNAIEPDSARDVDFNIHFADYATLINLLRGTENLMDTVLQGRVRSDGYIVWTFRLLMAVAAVTPPLPDQ